MRFVDQLAQDFAGRRIPVPFPEFDTTLYVVPLTAGDFMQVALRDPATATERNLRLVIAKTQREDGSPAFEPGDYETLRTKARWVLLERLAVALIADAETQMAQASQRIEDDGPLGSSVPSPSDSASP